MTESAYQGMIYHDSELGWDDMPDQWTIQDYTLCHALDVTDNVVAEEVVEARLETLDPHLARRVKLTSERGCFFAHATDEADVWDLAEHIRVMVQEGPYPSAISGDITASPAYINQGDGHVPASW